MACIIFLLVSSGVTQCLHAIIRESNFNNLALFKSEGQYAFCSRGIWIYIRECAMHLHTHPYSCMWEKSHHFWNERNHPDKSKVVVFTHRNDVSLHLFVLIKKLQSQRAWFKISYWNNLFFPLRGLERWYLEQLVKEKSLAPALALCLMILSSRATFLICREIGTNCIYNVILLNSIMYDKS